MVITIGNTKGGTGKSTTAFHLAVWLSRKKYDVLLIDADDAASTTTSLFTAHRANCLDNIVGYALQRYTGAALTREMKGLKEKYEHIIIDTGATDTQTLRTALILSDLMLIPCQPRVFDTWVTQTMAGKKNIIGDINAVRPADLKILTFISRADPRSQSNRDTVEALKGAGFTVLEEKMTNRKCFDNAIKEGRTIFEMEIQDEAHQKAIKELNNLFSEIFTHVDKHEQESGNAVTTNG